MLKVGIKGKDTVQVVYENTVTMNLEEFVSYILTQTNVIAKVEEQGESLSDATKWFHTTLKPIFNEQTQTIVCAGYNWYLKNQY